MKSADAELAVTVQRRDDLAVVELVGSLESASLGDLRRALDALVSDPAPTVVLDMARVPSVESEGFGLLIHAQKRLVESGKRLALAGCQEPVRAALALTGLEFLFPLYASLDSVQHET